MLYIIMTIEIPCKGTEHKSVALATKLEMFIVVIM